MSSEAGTIFADVYKALVDAGITVNAASGNAFSTAYGNNSGQNKPFASDPDTGTLGEPASYLSTLAVASVDAQDTSPYVLLGDRKSRTGSPSTARATRCPACATSPKRPTGSCMSTPEAVMRCNATGARTATTCRTPSSSRTRAAWTPVSASR